MLPGFFHTLFPTAGLGSLHLAAVIPAILIAARLWMLERTRLVLLSVGFCLLIAIAASASEFISGDPWFPMQGVFVTSIRQTLCAGLVVAVAGLLFYGIAYGARRTLIRSLRNNPKVWQPWQVDLPFAVLLAFVVPAMASLEQVHRLSDSAAELLGQQQWARALRKIDRLVELGSPLPIQGESPVQLQSSLQQEIARVTDAVSHASKTTGETLESRLLLARQLASLDRIPEAILAVQDLVAQSPTATLILATLLQDQQQWNDSDRCYRNAIVQLDRLPDSASKQSALVRAFSGLAYNARAAHEYQTAEQVYLLGIEHVPAAEAEFRFHLARHYQLGGRSVEAAEQFRRAMNLAPQTYTAAAAPYLRELRRHTPACLTGR